LMIESHINPDAAWSDAKQQVTPAVLGKIITIVSSEYFPLRNEDRARRMVGICDHGAADQRPFQQPAKLYAINTGYQLVCNLATP